MKIAIKLPKGYSPPEIKAAVKRINTALSEYTGEFQIDPYERYMERVYSSNYNKEYYIAENSEGGASSTVYSDGKWYYRTPWDGNDTEVLGGTDEVVANWICYFTG